MSDRNYDEEWHPRMNRWWSAIEKAKNLSDISQEEWNGLYISSQHPTEEQVKKAINTAEFVLKRNGFEIKDHGSVLVTKKES